MVFGDLAEKAAYERLVADFTRLHPQVQVTLVHVPGQGDYRKRLGIDFAAGTPADIVLLNYRRYAAFAAKGVLEPLGPALARSGVIRGTRRSGPACDERGRRRPGSFETVPLEEGVNRPALSATELVGVAVAA